MISAKNILHKLGLVESDLVAAQEGEYRNVFCPHCGEFIPHRYTVRVESKPEASGMEFNCPDCKRSGAVVQTTDASPFGR